MEKNRLEQIDVMRVVAAWLRCLLHTLVPFMVFRTGMWPVKYGNTDNLLPDFLVLTIHSFIMEAFFIVAGLIFAFESVRKGLRKYIQSRLKKIVFPFLAGILTLVPFIIVLFSVGESLTGSNFHWQFASWISDAWYNWSSHLFLLGHLWFLYYLIFYYAIVIAFSQFKYFRAGNLQKISWIHWLFCVPVLYICLSCGKRWYVENPLTTWIEWPSFIYYFLFFLFGAYLKDNMEKLSSLEDHLGKLLTAFLLLSCINGFLQSFYLNPSGNYQMLIRHGAYVASILQTLAGCMALYAFSLKHRSVAKLPWFSFQVRSAYWTYLVHAPIVMTLHIIFYSIAVHPVVKFMIILITSLTLAVWTYRIAGRKLLNI